MPVRPPASSCRAGGVVDFITASNVRVPVTLQISMHEEGEVQMYVVKVSLVTRSSHRSAALHGSHTVPILSQYAGMEGSTAARLFVPPMANTCVLVQPNAQSQFWCCEVRLGHC